MVTMFQISQCILEIWYLNELAFQRQMIDFSNFIVGKTEAEKTELSFGYKAKNWHWDINPKIFAIKPSVPNALVLVFCLY